MLKILLIINLLLVSLTLKAEIRTIAPPSAFGFLDTNISPITIQDSSLEVPEEQTLSVIGGDLQINDSILLARSGRINLAAVASKGEVILDEFSTNFDKLGSIVLSGNVDVRNNQY